MSSRIEAGFFNYKIRRNEETEQLYCEVTGYLQPETWRVMHFGGHNHYHRSLSDYMKMLRNHKMAMIDMHEIARPPKPDLDEVDASIAEAIPRLLMPYPTIIGLYQWNDMLKTEPLVELAELNSEDTLTLAYTSGSTGNPKGVMLSHKNILSNVEACIEPIPADQN